ncbi:MAG: hypothetical protein ABWW66_00645 [Archaeoglobaceae archaeon]
MSREVITTSILLIASVVAVTAAIMVILPAIKDLSHTYTSVATRLNEKVETDFEIIFVKAVQNSSGVDVSFWVKNVGKPINIDLLNNSDVFIVSSSQFFHFTLTDPNVSYSIENGDGDSYWETGETLNVTATSLQLQSGVYELTLVLYNGAKESDWFSW